MISAIGFAECGKPTQIVATPAQPDVYAFDGNDRINGHSALAPSPIPKSYTQPLHPITEPKRIFGIVAHVPQRSNWQPDGAQRSDTRLVHVEG